ncbi:MAG: GTP cyclohydrolase I FolE [Anaerolineaceae bacterium]
MDQEAIRKASKVILKAIGEDPNREGLLKTPERIARAYAEILSGYRTDPKTLINQALFGVDYDEMVIIKKIEFYSMCEHHMLPFFGHAHVAYIPKGKVIGLSKIPRIVEMYARRLQIQERMTKQIADFIVKTIHPLGVGVVVEGQHLCMMMRGVKKEQARMTTSAMRGTFRTRMDTRMEFLNRISNDSL